MAGATRDDQAVPAPLKCHILITLIKIFQLIMLPSLNEERNLHTIREADTTLHLATAAWLVRQYEMVERTLTNWSSINSNPKTSNKKKTTTTKKTKQKQTKNSSKKVKTHPHFTHTLVIYHLIISHGAGLIILLSTVQHCVFILNQY